MRKIPQDILKIDPLKLDEEWMNQPGLFMYWAEKAAKARERADRAKYLLERTTARVANMIRRDPDKFDLVKTTEAGINGAVQCHKDVFDANKEFISARADSFVLEKLVIALDHRRKALENLVYLHGQGYYSEPRRKERKVRGVKK